MITATVNAAREAEVAIQMGRGPTSTPHQMLALVDTGFNGYLTLPASVIAALNLRFAGHRRGQLADGTVVILDMYFATVQWHDGPRQILVSKADAVPLVGTALLYGSRLSISVINNGDVRIEPLP